MKIRIPVTLEVDLIKLEEASETSSVEDGIDKEFGWLDKSGIYLVDMPPVDQILKNLQFWPIGDMLYPSRWLISEEKDGEHKYRYGAESMFEALWDEEKEDFKSKEYEQIDSQIRYYLPDDQMFAKTEDIDTSGLAEEDYPIYKFKDPE